MRWTEWGLEWIESNGGPFLCIEKDHAALWGGIDFSSEPQSLRAGAETDYDRLGRCVRYSERLQVAGHDALGLTDPFPTTVWEARSGDKIIVSTQYQNPDIDFLLTMRSLPDSVFDTYDESCSITFEKGDVVIFDSAYPGSDDRKDCLNMQINPGVYEVRTVHISSAQKGWTLHRFSLRT